MKSTSLLHISFILNCVLGAALLFAMQHCSSKKRSMHSSHHQAAIQQVANQIQRESNSTNKLKQNNQSIVKPESNESVKENTSPKKQVPIHHNAIIDRTGYMRVTNKLTLEEAKKREESALASLKEEEEAKKRKDDEEAKKRKEEEGAKSKNTELNNKVTSVNNHTGSFIFHNTPTSEPNKIWWQQQFRPVDTSSLELNDPFAQSELYSNPRSPPLDQILTAYVQKFQDIVSQKHPESKDKVVVVSPNAQMANRLRITVFGLIVGVLLDKAVHVHFADDWYSDMHDIITPLVDLTSNALDRKECVRCRQMDMKSALCDDWSTWRHENAGISISGNSYLTSLLTHNNKLQDRIHQVFGNYTDYYRMIFTRFFRPSGAIQERLAAFRSAHKLGDKLVVGLHIRSGPDFRSPMTDQDWQNFKACAEMMTGRVKKRMPTAQVVWVVVADTEAARQRSAKEFESNTHSAQILHYDSFLISNNKQGVQNAFMDMLLVTFADARVLTPCSSYSEFAFTMGGALGDSVFVKSATPDGPRNCYLPTQIKQVGEHGFCFRPTTLDPSFEELDDVLKGTDSSCRHT